MCSECRSNHSSLLLSSSLSFPLLIWSVLAFPESVRCCGAPSSWLINSCLNPSYSSSSHSVDRPAFPLSDRLNLRNVMSHSFEPEDGLELFVSSVPWFVTFMRLHNSGVTPTVTPNENMPNRVAMAEFWGPRSSSGFRFHDHGHPSYEAYVRSLFPRVLQKPWPASSVLPFHFARVLLVEALGVQVNWAEFAFRVTHPHQANIKVPRVLPEFMELRTPLPPVPCTPVCKYMELRKDPCTPVCQSWVSATFGPKKKL